MPRVIAALFVHSYAYRVHRITHAIYAGKQHLYVHTELLYINKYTHVYIYFNIYIYVYIYTYAYVELY